MSSKTELPATKFEAKNAIITQIVTAGEEGKSWAIDIDADQMDVELIRVTEESGKKSIEQLVFGQFLEEEKIADDETESVILEKLTMPGVDTLLDIQRLLQADQNAKAVCKLIIPDGKRNVGTGFIVNGKWLFTTSTFLPTYKEAKTCTLKLSDMKHKGGHEFEEVQRSETYKADASGVWFYSDEVLHFSVMRITPEVPKDFSITLPKFSIEKDGVFKTALVGYEKRGGTTVALKQKELRKLKFFDESNLLNNRCNMIGFKNDKKVIGFQKNLIKEVHANVFHFATWSFEAMIGGPLFDNEWNLIGLFFGTQTSNGYFTSEGLRFDSLLQKFQKSNQPLFDDFMSSVNTTPTEKSL